MRSRTVLIRGWGLVRSAWAFSFLAVSNAGSKSPSSRTGSDMICIPNAWAAISVSLRGYAGPNRTATRPVLGTASLRSSSRFPSSSGPWILSPVIFFPGRAKLSTRPVATGSATAKKTIGIVLVAFWAAWTAEAEAVMITSTLRPTSSAASSGSRSSFPSAYRYSKAMFFPSTYPCSRRPLRNTPMRGETDAAEDATRTPIRETLPACCASATSGASVRPRVRMTSSPISRMDTSVEGDCREV